ncbi:MAG: SRPBCC domain-containing protein [Anaerolineales bacterium]
MAETIADREIVVTRVIDAPRELVFEAFTEQKHAENWWIPKGTTREWNAQPGGLWRYSQPGPGSAELAFRIKFVEIDKPNRFVYEFGTDAEDAPDPVLTTVTFEDQDGKTKVTLQLVFATAAAKQENAKYGAEKGARLALDNLANYVAGL